MTARCIGLGLLVGGSFLIGCGGGVSKQEASALPAIADPAPARPESFGQAALLGGFVGSTGRQGESLVGFEVGYENDTPYTFSRVKIWCRAFDARGFQIGAAEWVLSEALDGPIVSGSRHRRVLELRLKAAGPVERIDCAVVGGGV